MYATSSLGDHEHEPVLRTYTYRGSQNEGYCLEVPSIMVIVFGGLYWVPLILGIYYLYMHIYVSREAHGMSSKARF